MINKVAAKTRQILWSDSHEWTQETLWGEREEALEQTLVLSLWDNACSFWGGRTHECRDKCQREVGGFRWMKQAMDPLYLQQNRANSKTMGTCINEYKVTEMLMGQSWLLVGGVNERQSYQWPLWQVWRQNNAGKIAVVNMKLKWPGRTEYIPGHTKMKKENFE